MPRSLTAIIGREGAGYVSLCPELDIASQGDTVEQAEAFASAKASGGRVVSAFVRANKPR